MLNREMTTKEQFTLEMLEQSMQGHKVGTIIEAAVVGRSAAGIVVNIGGKHDGLIPADEAAELAALSKGEKLNVMICSNKAIDGLLPVSAKKAVDIIEKNVQIPNIKKGVQFEAIVDSSGKAGLNCFFGSYKVFVPASEVEEFYVRDLERYKGKKLELVATDFDEENRRIVASHKVVSANTKAAMQELFWHGIFINKIVTGTVARITPFGAFVTVDGVDCLVHNSEISYDKTAEAKDILTVGQSYQFRVILVDREVKRVQLSYKQLQIHPFDEKIKSIKVGDVVKVVITKILPFGAVARLDNGLEGFIHISEVTGKTFVKNVYEVCKVGECKQAVIKEIESQRKRIALSLKALENPEYN